MLPFKTRNPILPKSNITDSPMKAPNRGLPVLQSVPPIDWASTEACNWEGKQTNVLVLNYTMACPLACDFCCYGCHPGRAEKMPIDLALSLVRQAAEMNVFSLVGFTGGEAMLFIEELLTIGTTLLKLKLPFGIATACHWATSADEARRIVNALADRGLCSFHISYDPSHEKFIPTDYITNAAYAASERGIATYIVGAFYSPSESLTALLPELVDLPKVTFVDKYVARIGRAATKDITQQTYGMKLELEDLCCYKRIYHDITIFYDGTVYPCCSTFNRVTPGIILGNAYKDSLSKLWKRAEGSLMFQMMKRQGFARVYEIIKDFDADLYKKLPSADSIAGPCQLCNSIFGQPELAQRVHEVFNKHEQAKISSVIDVLTQMLGEDKAKEFIKSTIARSEISN